MAIDLITAAEYKAYKSISGPSLDAILSVLIPKASTLVKKYCRRTFVDYVSTDKVQISRGGDFLFLEETPIISVSSVAYSSDYGVTYTNLTENTDWVLDQELQAILPISADFVVSPNAYKITYRAGYTTLPDDLKLAVLDLVQYYVQNDASIHSPKAPGTNSVQIEYVSTTSLPAHIRRILDLNKADYL